MVRSHQRFADQECVITGGTQSCYVGSGMDPAFGDTNTL